MSNIQVQIFFSEKELNLIITSALCLRQKLMETQHSLALDRLNPIHTPIIIEVARIDRFISKMNRFLEQIEEAPWIFRMIIMDKVVQKKVVKKNV